MQPKTRLKLLALFLTLALFLSVVPTVQAQKPDANSDDATQESILQTLDQTIEWYRGIDGMHATPDNARETVVMTELQKDAAQVLGFAFDYARARAATLNPVVATDDDDDSDDTKKVDPSKLAAFTNSVNAQLTSLQAQLNDINAQLKTTTAGASRATLLAQRHQVSGALAFAQAQHDLLSQVKGFISGNQADADKSLIGSINSIEQGFPEIHTDANGFTVAPTADKTPGDTTTAVAKAPTPAERPHANPGILAAIGEFFPLWHKRGQIDEYLKRTAALEKENDDLHKAARTQLQALLAQGKTAMAGNAIPAAPPAATTTTKTPAATTPPAPAAPVDLSVLAIRLREVTAMIVPLGAQHQALEDSKLALTQWHALLDRDFATSLCQLIIRLIMLTIVVGIPLVLSEIARRGTTRYVKDARLRRQLRTVRRLVVGVIIGIVIFVSLFSEVGSFATYAGLLTAGMAVALQNVILSAFCYFFLLGRFGIRVGERVTVGTTTGEVIEVGLLRIYIMEMANNAATGRIAVFPNLIFFQPTAFFKQVAGANYIWHDITLHFVHDVDQGLLRSKLLAAAGGVYADYHQDLKRQHAALENATHLRIEMPHPDCTIEVLPDGVACTVHYPLELGREKEIDKRMNEVLMKTVQSDARLQLAGTEKAA